MKVIERSIDNPAEESVVLKYVTWTRDFAEIKEYAQNKGRKAKGKVDGN